MTTTRYVIELNVSDETRARGIFDFLCREQLQHANYPGRLIEVTPEPDDPDHHPRRRVIAAHNFGEQ